MSLKKTAAIKRTLVSSSQINSVGYDPVTKTLEIEFRNNGSIYQYYNVPEAEYKALINSDSVGRHFSDRIKNNKKYPYNKIA